MRIALLALVLGGCGALSASGAETAQVAADGLFDAAMTLASRTRPATDMPRHHGPRTAGGTHRYHCWLGDGEQQSFLARSLARAESACGTDCSCIDPVMFEELRLYQRQHPEY